MRLHHRSGPWLTLAITLAIAVGATTAAHAEASYVWWEAEAADGTNFPAQTWLTPKPGEAEHLSGGNWLTNSGTRSRTEPYARYTVSAPVGGRWELWVRKFWHHGPFRWRFDEAPWQTCDRNVALADHTDLRADVCANWVYLGTVELTRGHHKFQLRLTTEPGEKFNAAFDCFVLSRQGFVPNGKWKPNQRAGLAADGWFAYEPQPDRFGDDALLDLRHLNEETAGASGFIATNDQGQLTLGSGEPVRFWSVNLNAENAGQHRGTIDYLARKLAKQGVNMVRYHTPLFDPYGDLATVDPKRLDDLHYLVAACKRQGIYTSISCFFPQWIEITPEHGWAGYETIRNKRPFGLWFFDSRLQAIHRQWMTTLLSTENPYTGTPLAREPALAMVELVNEDSLFFWTFSHAHIPQPQWRTLQRTFGRWLIQRYGSLNNAIAAWGGAREREDDPDSGEAVLYEAWWMTGEARGKFGAPKRRRIGDQIRFLAHLQGNAYRQATVHLEKDLGLGGLVVAGNWKVTDPAHLEAVEHLTYCAGDVIDRHAYFGGTHQGKGASYSVRVGHTYSDKASVLNPQLMPVQAAQVMGRPTIISELGWPNPNRYRGEATFLASTFASLQSIDGLCFFAVGNNAMRDTSMMKFAVSSPAIAGAFPAAALLYRRGDVAEAPPVWIEEVDGSRLFALGEPGPAAAVGLDPLRASQVPSGPGVEGGIDPLSFFVGPILRSFEPGRAIPAVVDPAPHVDRDRQLIVSATGEVHWNYATGLVTVDTPRSQGAVGFLAGAGSIALGTVTIESGNEFGSVTVIALDDRPVAESRRILIQAITEERPYGFEVEAGRITDLGGSPFNVRNVDATLTLRLATPGPHRVVALDENGYPTGQLVSQTTGADGLTIRLSPNAMYHVVETAQGETTTSATAAP